MRNQFDIDVACDLQQPLNINSQMREGFELVESWFIYPISTSQHPKQSTRMHILAMEFRIHWSGCRTESVHFRPTRLPPMGTNSTRMLLVFAATNLLGVCVYIYIGQMLAGWEGLSWLNRVPCDIDVVLEPNLGSALNNIISVDAKLAWVTLIF